jgi:hypothetical protein
MLTLMIDGVSVDLPNDFSMTMNLKSPIFGLLGSYSYPFRIPATPKNKALFGFLHRPENTGDHHQVRSGSFFWNGICIFHGSMQLTSFNSTYYEGTILESEGDFYNVRKTLSLQQVDFGTLTFANANERIAYINSCRNVRYPDKIVAFPQIKNLSYWNPMPEGFFNQSMNVYTSTGIATFIPSTSTRTIIVPMLYLRYVLKKIFEHIGYSLDDSFFAEDSDYNSLALFNLVDCNTSTTGYFAYDEHKLLLNYHLPMMSINDFLTGLESFFNIRFFINNLTRKARVISVDDIVKSADYIEMSSNLVSINHDVEDKVNGWNIKMTIDSDDSVAAEISSMAKAAVDRVKEPVATVALLPPWPSSIVLDQRFVYEKGMYYQMQTDLAWHPAPSSIGLINLMIEAIYKVKGDESVTPFSTLFTDTTTNEGIIGNSMEKWREVTPKIFFMKHQLTGGTLGQPRDTAMSYSDTKNLFYDGDNGMVKQNFMAYWDFLMQARAVKITRQMPFLELRDFDFSKKYMVNGVKYLVKSIQVTLKKDRIMPAVLECYSCG